jgi:energy-coupling factor transport system ATP-binding protein
MSAGPLLDIQHVTYAYPVQARPQAESPAIPVLRDLSLQVQEGEYVVLLGHNGCGKSTLARLCNGLLQPDRGRVLVDGHDTRDSKQRRTIRESVGMVFQNPDNQIIATVVEDDVAWALAVRGWSRAAIKERVDAAMMAVGIATLRHLPPSRLSGGQRQRVALAGILALRPRCIITDEATSMLDPLSRQEITRLLHQLHQEQKLTLIQITHLLEEAALAERVVVMSEGQVVLDGPPEVIFRNLALLRSLKLEIPEPLLLAERLRQTGLPISPDAVTLSAIAEELAP